jgi:hypothetical protein
MPGRFPDNPERLPHNLLYQRRFVAVWASLLVVPGSFMLGVLSPNATSGPIECIVIGLILGTLLGHTTLAAVWTALGPLPFAVRPLRACPPPSSLPRRGDA